MYNHLPVQCHPCLMWPLVLPLNLTYTLLITCCCFQWIWPTKTPTNHPILRTCVTFITCWFLWWRIVCPAAYSQAGGPSTALSAAYKCLFSRFTVIIHNVHATVTGQFNIASYIGRAQKFRLWWAKIGWWDKGWYKHVIGKLSGKLRRWEENIKMYCCDIYWFWGGWNFLRIGWSMLLAILNISVLAELF
jgi:hypothetical protein